MNIAFSLRKCVLLCLALSLGLLAGCQKPETPSASAAAPNPAPSSTLKPAIPSSFDDVTAHLDPGGELYLYLSTAQWLGNLSHSLDTLHDLVLSGSANQSAEQRQSAETGFALFKDVVQKSGVEEITGIGASSFPIAPGLFRNKLFLHHYPGKNAGILWSLYGTQAHALTGLDLLPADTGLAGIGDFDIAGLINFLRQEADQSGIPEFKQAVDQWQTQFAGVSGLPLDQVLNSLNGSVGMVLTLDSTSTVTIPTGPHPETFPAPRLAILIAVKNDLIFNRVDKMTAGYPGMIKADEPDLRMRTMPVPALPSFNLRPSIAQWNGFLVIASDDKLIRDMMAVQKGGAGYKSTPEYAALSSGMPDQGNSFAVVSSRFAEAMRKFQSDMVSSQSGGDPRQGAMLQKMFSSSQSLGRLFSVGGQLPDGWLTTGQGSQGSSQLILPLVVAPAAMGFGMAATVPAFSHTMHHAMAPPSPTRPPIPPSPPQPPAPLPATPPAASPSAQ